MNGNRPLDTPSPSPLFADPDSLSREASLAARAALVNRTHRVVHERAERLRSRRSRSRSLWVPMLVCALFVPILCSAVWWLLDQYDLSPTGIPDASSQIFIMLLWFLPVTAAMLALALLRRARTDRDLLQ